MADELSRVETWLFGVLAADAPLTALIGGAGNQRIYGEVAPQDSTWPCVVYQFQGGHDVGGGTGASHRIMVDGLWLVKAIMPSKSFAGLVPIVDRVDTVLRASSGGAAGADGVVFASVREQPFRLVELDEGVTYRHLGGLYRIWTQVP